MPPEHKIHFTPQKTILFMVVLSLISAIILSVLASSLRPAQAKAKELDRSKEMLKSAMVLNHEGYFQLPDGKGKFIPARYVGEGKLEPSNSVAYPTQSAILGVYNKRVVPRLVTRDNRLISFEEAGIDQAKYVEEYRVAGYYKQKLKLIYLLLPNPGSGKGDQPIAYIIPVNGMGLWDAIYGYLAIEPDGDTVIGTSWYDQKETPGLGAIITEWSWQKHFPGKRIFQEAPDGKTRFKSAPLGIQVVRGKVAEIYDHAPKAKSAVDGIAGATLTGNGVTDAYKNTLEGYRPFLVQLATSKKQ